MNFNDYQREAKKTLQPPRDDLPIELYLAWKLAQEAFEAQQLIVKHFYHNTVMDVRSLVKEIGDVIWYSAMLADHYGWNLDDVAEANIEKLRARHGESYNPEHYRTRVRIDTEGVHVYDYESEDTKE